MPHQDFGPVRLTLPSIDAAIQWRAVLLKLKSSDLGDPVDSHLAQAAWSATVAAALSSATDSEGKPQSWGDLARGKSPAELVNDPIPGSSALSGLRELGAGYTDLVNLSDEIVSWLTENIVKPVEAGEGRSSFFARKQAH